MTLYNIAVNKLRNLLIISTIALSTGCRKFITVPSPTNTLTSSTVYQNESAAASVVTNLYTSMSNFQSSFCGPSGVSVFAGCSADELTVFDVNNDAGDISRYYQNNLTAKTGNTLWFQAYILIFDANSAIEGIQNSTSISNNVKRQLIGEALFVRSFIYFYLVNQYGDVPLVMSTDYKETGLQSRTPKTQVYQQMIADLKQSELLLSSSYLAGDIHTVTTEKVRPTKWAAAALLARVYLYYGNLSGDATNYINAELQADSVINNNVLIKLDSLDNVFKKNSNEAIWQLQPTNNAIASNANDGAFFILPSTGPNTDSGGHPVYLNIELCNAFELGDKRKQKWVNSVIVNGITYYYPFKYKIGLVDTTTLEYTMVLRLGEQYLIRAEARVQQNKLTEATADLNVIRKRAGLGVTTAATQADLLAAILKERRFELFSEWGHRWFDLKRTNNVDQVMSTATIQKGATWNPNDALYPVPLSEIQADPKLTQNPGY